MGSTRSRRLGGPAGRRGIRMKDKEGGQFFFASKTTWTKLAVRQEERPHFFASTISGHTTLALLGRSRSKIGAVEEKSGPFQWLEQRIALTNHHANQPEP